MERASSSSGPRGAVRSLDCKSSWHLNPDFYCRSYYLRPTFQSAVAQSLAVSVVFLNPAFVGRKAFQYGYHLPRNLAMRHFPDSAVIRCHDFLLSLKSPKSEVSCSDMCPSLTPESICHACSILCFNLSYPLNRSRLLLK